MTAIIGPNSIPKYGYFSTILKSVAFKKKKMSIRKNNFSSVLDDAPIKIILNDDTDANIRFSTTCMLLEPKKPILLNKIDITRNIIGIASSINDQYFNSVSVKNGIAATM
jgi:hypothetical protein